MVGALHKMLTVGHTAPLLLWSTFSCLLMLKEIVGDNDLCYKLSPYKAQISHARSTRCSAIGAELMQVLEPEDVLRVFNITRGILPSSEQLVIDGYFHADLLVWRFSNGTLMTWFNWDPNITPAVTGSPVTYKQYILMRLTDGGFWYHRTSKSFRYFICQTIKVSEASSSGSCYQPAPAMGNAIKTENSTHVNYTCNTNFMFADGNTTMIYECSCAALANLDPCKPVRRDVCWTPTFGQWYQPTELRAYCKYNNATLPRLVSQSENDAFQAMMIENDYQKVMLDIYRSSHYLFKWADGSQVYYTNFRPGYPWTTSTTIGVFIYGPTGKWDMSLTGQTDLVPMCEVQKVKVVGGCEGVERPTFPNANMTSQNSTHVTFTCDPDHVFPDNTTEKTMECGCEKAMLIHGCHPSTRADLCLVESSVKRSQTAALKYCQQNGGALAVTFSQTEQNRLLTMSTSSHLWLAASDADQEQLWKWRTGHLVFSANYDSFHGVPPSNTSQNSLLLDRVTGMWKDAHSEELHGFVCESRPNADCTTSAPFITNAKRTLTSTDVTYQCLDGYSFLDGTVEKHFGCICFGILTTLRCRRRTAYVSSYTTTLADSAETCSHLGGSLVDVNDARANTTVVTLLERWQVGSTWISPTSTFVAEFVGPECLSVDLNGQWTDTECSQLKHFVCTFGHDADAISWESKSKLSCWKANDLLWGVPDDLVPTPPCQRSNIYFTPGTTLPWTAAGDMCSTLGGHLAAATSHDEAMILAAFSERYSLGSTWIGAMETGDGVQWLTKKALVAPPGVNMTTTAGDAKDCLQTDGLTWTDGNCSIPIHFVCEREIGPTWPDSNFCMWREDVMLTWAEADSLCQTHQGSLNWVDNVWDWNRLVDLSGTSVIWLGGKEEMGGVWKLPSGDPISWSLWAEDGQDTGQLGCMVYDGQSHRMREHSCTATDVTSFFCRRSGPTTPDNMRVVHQGSSVLTLGCNSGYGFSNGSSQRSVTSSMNCKTMTTWMDLADEHTTCYPTNTFTMKHFGNYSAPDELALSDDNHQTCADLKAIWSKGPKTATFTKIWGGTLAFTVTIVTGDELRNLLTTHGNGKMSMMVKVSEELPWDGNIHGIFGEYRSCTDMSDLTYRCECTVEVCSLFVSITIRDDSVLNGVGSLNMCDISIAGNV